MTRLSTGSSPVLSKQSIDTGVEPVRLGTARQSHLFPLLVGLSALVCAAVLYLTSYKSFYLDEWAFVASRREWRLDLFLISHNGHWSFIPILIWKVLFVLVGLRSYVPYEAAALIVHMTAVLLLFILVRRRSGDLLAFASATTLLVLGAGGENIVWAFQIGWVGSVSFGLLAMLLLDSNPDFPGHVLPASAALLFSLMCSSVGLVFVGALGIELAFDPRRRRFLVGLIVPIAAFIAWFFVYDTGNVPGSPGVTQSFLHGPTGLNYLIDLGRFVASGVEATAAGVVGLPGFVGTVLFAVIVALVAVHWYRRRTVRSWQLGMACAIPAWFALAGLGRLQYGPSYATQSRYIYVAAIFLLPLLADALTDIPWRGLWRPILTSAFALCILGNAVQLRDLAISQKGLMQLQAAELQTVEVFRGAPDMVLTRTIDDDLMPQLTAGVYLTAVAELGSPVPRLTLNQLQRLPAAWVDRALLDVFGPTLAISSDQERSTRGLSCRTVQGSNLDLQVLDGQPLMLRSTVDADAVISLGFLGPPNSSASIHVKLPPGSAEWVHLPQTGKPIYWQIRVATAALETIEVCGSASLQVTGGAVSLYAADAASGSLDPGWLRVSDFGGRQGDVAKAEKGDSPSFRNVLFGRPVIPVPAAYDVWYRVRVASNTGSKTEMTLGLWDDEGVTWVGSTSYRADQAGTSYSWLRVASHVTPVKGHSVQFVASMTNGPGTDWFVDEAVMVTAGSAPPV